MTLIYEYPFMDMANLRLLINTSICILNSNSYFNAKKETLDIGFPDIYILGILGSNQ